MSPCSILAFEGIGVDAVVSKNINVEIAGEAPLCSEFEKSRPPEFTGMVIDIRGMVAKLDVCNTGAGAYVWS